MAPSYLHVLSLYIEVWIMSASLAFGTYLILCVAMAGVIAAVAFSAVAIAVLL